jgi:uncharacterized protein YgiM (DUF1202 family)
MSVALIKSNRRESKMGKHNNYNKMFNEKNREVVNREPNDEQKLEVEPSEEKSKEPRMAKVISPGKLNVRKGPDKSSDVICLVSPDANILIEDVDGDWAHIYTDVGIEGYVMVEFIKEV